MNELPNEILQIIFKKLKVRDLIQCRLICKRFMCICDSIKIPELIISNQIENKKDLWFAINKQFSHKDAIDITTYKRWRSASTLRLGNIVRRLHFSGSFSDYLQLNLNNLTELEQLKIDLDECCQMKHYIDINLPNLKILEFGNESEGFIFNVTAPSLEKLKCERFEKNRIEYPSNITHLEVHHFQTTRANTLTNLQYLKIRYGDLPNSNILSVFPRLVTLVCCNSYRSMQSLRSIVEQKLILKRSELKIYCRGVEFVGLHKLNELYAEDSSLMEYQINNYNLLCDDAYSFIFHYNEVMRLFHGQIPNDFFKKYSNTDIIFVFDKVESQEHLMEFLKQFDYLSFLYLATDSLDKSFFDGLYAIGNLTHLVISVDSSITNFDFLFNLKMLNTFRMIGRDAPEAFDLSLTLYERLKYFVSIRFDFEGELIDIKKKKHLINYRFAQYSIWRGHAIVEDGLDFNELVRAINESQNNKHKLRNRYY